MNSLMTPIRNYLSTPVKEVTLGLGYGVSFVSAIAGVLAGSVFGLLSGIGLFVFGISAQIAVRSLLETGQSG